MESRISNKNAHRFCRVARALGFISEKQAREVLEEQTSNNPAVRLRPHRMVGEIMLEKGWLTTRQIEIIMSQVSKARA